MVAETGVALVAAIEPFRDKVRARGDPAGEVTIELHDFMAALATERDVPSALIEQRAWPTEDWRRARGWSELAQLRLATLNAQLPLLAKRTEIARVQTAAYDLP